MYYFQLRNTYNKNYICSSKLVIVLLIKLSCFRGMENYFTEFIDSKCAVDEKIHYFFSCCPYFVVLKIAWFIDSVGFFKWSMDKISKVVSF